MLRRACVAAMPSAAHRLGETVPAALRSGARPAVVANPRGVPNAAVVQQTLAAYAAGGAPAAPADLPPHDLVGAFLRAVDRLDDAIAEPVERRAARDAYLGAMLKAALRVATTMAAQPVRGSGRGGRPTAGTPTQTRAPGSGIAETVEPGVALPAAAVLAPPPPPVADDPSDNDDRSEAGAAEHSGGDDDDGGGSGGRTSYNFAWAFEGRGDETRIDALHQASPRGGLKLLGAVPLLQRADVAQRKPPKPSVDVLPQRAPRVARLPLAPVGRRRRRASRAEFTR